MATTRAKADRREPLGCLFRHCGRGVVHYGEGLVGDLAGYAAVILVGSNLVTWCAAIYWTQVEPGTIMVCCATLGLALPMRLLVNRRCTSRISEGAIYVQRGQRTRGGGANEQGARASSAGGDSGAGVESRAGGKYRIRKQSCARLFWSAARRSRRLGMDG